MKIGLEYIKYRRKAKHRHGIHSPFVYNFTDVCLKTPISEDDKRTINNLISKLKYDKRIIEITDLGVGSKKMGNERRVNRILKNSSSKGKYGELLYRISRHYKPEHILELGTSLGIGTIQMAMGSPGSLITTVEGCPNTLILAKENFDKVHISPIAVNDNFRHFLSTMEPKQFDLVFIDGHHDGRALVEYMAALSDFTHDDTLFILDDIRWSDSMKEAWTKLAAQEDYHLSIDLFRMGILSKRSAQAKEHFTLRF